MARLAIFRAEQVAASGFVHDALVNVHRAARLAGHGFGHEGGEHVVAQRHFAHGALEEEHLIGQAQRVGVEEVDFHLAGADFVDQGVHVQLHLVAVVVDLLEQRVELVHRVDGIGLARGFSAATAADGRFERHVRVGVARHQVKLQLGRHHWHPALGFEQITHPAQHRTRCEGHQVAVAVVAIVDHLGGRIAGPRHDAHRGRIGAQVHVVVNWADDIEIRAGLRHFPGHAHGDDGLRQPHAPIFGELLARQDLAACHPGEVGHQAFDFGDAVDVEPVFQLGEGEVFSAGHGEAPGCFDDAREVVPGRASPG